MLRDFTKEEFDIIIQAGQSNAEGSGNGDATSPYVPKEEVWYLTGDFTINMAAERVTGNNICSDFSLSFADEYIKKGYLKNGRKLLILRTAVGGTGFCDHRWGPQDDLYLRMMEMIKTALALNENNKLVAFLWHQGETDAGSDVSYDTYYNNISTLYNSVMSTYNCEELPFIAGDFARIWRNTYIDKCLPVLNALENYTKEVKNGAWVTTDELPVNCEVRECDDGIHFCRESLYILGRKYFAAFEDMIK